MCAVGVFELQIRHFQNPNGLLQTGACCDLLANGGQRCSARDQCDTFFKVCLKEYQARVVPNGACTFGSANTGILGGNSQSLRHRGHDGGGVGGGEDGTNGLIGIPFKYAWPVSTGEEHVISMVTKGTGYASSTTILSHWGWSGLTIKLRDRVQIHIHIFFPSLWMCETTGGLGDMGIHGNICLVHSMTHWLVVVHYIRLPHNTIELIRNYEPLHTIKPRSQCCVAISKYTGSCLIFFFLPTPPFSSNLLFLCWHLYLSLSSRLSWIIFIGSWSHCWLLSFVSSLKSGAINLQLEQQSASVAEEDNDYSSQHHLIFSVFFLSLGATYSFHL